MATSRISGVRIAGVASAIPEKFVTAEDDARVFGEAEIRKISESIGVKKRHVAPTGMCTSDLCFAASERLLSELDWSRESVDGLIFVSQSPDYFLPATSCCLQERLGLSKQCAALDINLGCSGYVYGLWVASHLLAGESVKRILLLVGDTSTQKISPHDRSVVPLFGDAGTATALERNKNAGEMVFQLGTDGSGKEHLIVPAGGFRHPHTERTAQRKKGDDGNIRSDEETYMNGAEIFAFTLREVPPLIKSVLGAAGWQAESVDAFVMHQANRFMLQHLAKKMKLPPERVIVALEDYGNTSSASIPLAMTHALAGKLKADPLRLVLAGFGVGFSWGAVTLTCGPAVMPDLVFVSESAVSAAAGRSS
jgi:3-oxoacyl-[acyl-carrier-protein] synthase-3